MDPEAVFPGEKSSGLIEALDRIGSRAAVGGRFPGEKSSGLIEAGSARSPVSPAAGSSFRGRNPPASLKLPYADRP